MIAMLGKEKNKVKTLRKKNIESDNVALEVIFVSFI
jgi:hypothetical protein